MIKKAALILCILVFFLTYPLAVSASEATGYTFTISSDSGEMEIVADAFLPQGGYLSLGLSGPLDMDIKNGLIYIADTGNKRIVVLDPETSMVREIGKGVLNKPEGVAADDLGRIYVADYNNRAVYRFSAEGELEQVFEKPEGAIYGTEATFAPKKVAPDGNGGVYVVVDGSVNGLVQMDEKGEFVGYFATNSVNKGLYYKFLDVFLTEKQLETFASFTPDSFGNIFFGEEGLVYAICMGNDRKIQKLNYAGNNIYASRSDMVAVDGVVDICMSPNGYIYLLNEKGMITELTDEGHLLYMFGGKNGTVSQFGKFTTPAGIGVDEEGRVYVLDAGTNNIQVFEQTAEHKEIVRALDSYAEGDYATTKEVLLKTLKYNSSCYFAHLYLGMTYMHEGNYELAAEEFEEAEVWTEYSEAYWELRNVMLEKNIVYIFLVVCLAVAGLLWWKKKHPAKAYSSYADLDSIRTQWQQYTFKNVKRIVFHPIDAGYLLRTGRLGHGYSAPVLVIFVGFIVLSVWRLCSGNIFSVSLEDYPVYQYFAFYAAVFALFILCHYLVVSIMDGESDLKMIVSVVSFGLLPFIFTFPLFTLLKNFLTLNEKLLVSTLECAVILWCFVLILVLLKLSHNYSIGKLLGSLVITVFLMAMVVLFGSLLYLLLKQIFDFILQIYTEVIIRV